MKSCNAFAAVTRVCDEQIISRDIQEQHNTEPSGGEDKRIHIRAVWDRQETGSRLPAHVQWYKDNT